MATSRADAEHIIDMIGDPRLTIRAMFGEFAVYDQGKVVALICDGRLYVKKTPATADLAAHCDTDAPYPGAKPHYVVGEEQLDDLPDLAAILASLAASLPEPKPKSKAKPKTASGREPRRRKT